MKCLAGLSALLRVGVLSTLLWSGMSIADPLPPLRLGIMPFNSALALIKTHQPLTNHLEMALGRKVAVYTSTDYFTYLNQLLDGQFDLAIAGPHFGSLARKRGATLLVRYAADLQPVVVVHKDGHIQTLDDLRGKRIGLSSRLSISSIGGAKWLQDGGFILGRDYQLSERSTHGAAITGVAVGELDAALTTFTPLKQVPTDVQEKIRILPLNMHVPHLMTLADARLKPAEVEQIRRALQSFPETPEGRRFFEETGYKGYLPVTSADLEALEPFVTLTLKMMRLEK